MTRFRSQFLAAVALSGSLFIAGCGDSVTDENFAKINNDMSRKQVEKIMGGEGDEETSGGFGVSSSGLMTGNSTENNPIKTFSWKSGDKMIIVDFRGDKVVNKSKRGF
jgi:hypothetical protein